MPLQDEITNDVIYSTIGARVSERRKLLGLPQRVLASALGVSVNRISQLERGETWSALNVAQACEVLGVKPSDLFPRADETPSAEMLTPAEKRMVEAMRRKDLREMLRLVGDVMLDWDAERVHREEAEYEAQLKAEDEGRTPAGPRKGRAARGG